MANVKVKDLTETQNITNDNKLMVLTDENSNQVKNITVENFIDNINSSDTDNGITIGTDGKLYVDNSDSGVTPGTYQYVKNLEVNAQGKITSIEEGEATPLATASTPGIVQPDENSITVDSDGIISALLSTASTPGIVQPDGNTITVDSNGVISASLSTPNTPGIVQPDGNTIVVDNGGKISVPNKQDLLYDGYDISIDKQLKFIDLSSNLPSGYGTWSHLVYGDNKFFAYTSTGYVTYSIDDGQNWETPVQDANLATRTDWNSTAYGNGLFVQVGNAGYVSTSTDGINWTTPIDTTLTGTAVYPTGSIIYDGIQFLIFNINGTSYRSMAVSSDGTTWTINSVSGFPATFSINSVVFAQNKYISITSIGQISTSTDAINWTTPVTNNNLGRNSWRKIVYFDNKFIAFSNYTSTAYSEDGENWTNAAEAIVTSHPTNSYFKGIACSDKNLITFVGSNARIIRANSLVSTLNKTLTYYNYVSDMATEVSASTTDVEYNVRNVFPHDNYIYLAIISGWGATGTTSGNRASVVIESDLGVSVSLMGATTRASSNVQFRGCAVIPVGTGRTLTVKGVTNPNGMYTITLIGYIRLCTDTIGSIS